MFPGWKSSKLPPEFVCTEPICVRKRRGLWVVCKISLAWDWDDLNGRGWGPNPVLIKKPKAAFFDSRPSPIFISYVDYIYMEMLVLVWSYMYIHCTCICILFYTNILGSTITTKNKVIPVTRRNFAIFFRFYLNYSFR